MTKDLPLFDDVDAPRTAVQSGDDLEAAMNVGIDAAVARLFTPPTAPADLSVVALGTPPAPMTDEEYHAHLAVSATDLKRAFERGPWYAPWCRANKTTSKAMDQGTRIHAAMLTRELIDVSQYVARPNGYKFNANPGKAWKELQEANGLTVVEANEFAFYQDANRVLSDWQRLLDSVPGTWTFETPVFWHDREGVDCRCKPDAVCFDGARVTLFSVKTTAKPVTAAEWRRQVESRIVADESGVTVYPGYDIAERHYAEGLAQHYLGDAERWAEVVVVHIIVPTEGPLCLYHAPVPAELLQRVGRLRSDMLPMVADAIETYPACVPGGVMSLTYAPSKWAARDMEDEA